MNLSAVSHCFSDNDKIQSVSLVTVKGQQGETHECMAYKKVRVITNKRLSIIVTSQLQLFSYMRGGRKDLERDERTIYVHNILYKNIFSKKKHIKIHSK